MSKYSDTTEVKKLTDDFLSLNDKDEIQTFIETNLPNWLIAATDSYTVDYPHLQRNWHQICTMNSVEPQKIVIVDEIVFDDDHSLTRLIAETMTRKGYVVRRKEELTGCSECRQAMPTKPVWTKFVHHGLNVPKKWKTICSNCEKRL